MLALWHFKTRKLPQGLAGIIGVHDGVDDVIHDDEPPRAGSVLGPAEKGVHEHGHVMVPERETISSQSLCFVL